MRIGNTPAEVRRIIPQLVVVNPARRRFIDYRAFPSEEKLLGIPCPRCGEKGLCLSETGLPLSGPHQERIPENPR